MPESCDDFLIDLALEGHDQLRQHGHRLPFPAVELGGVSTGRRIDGDFALVTLETIGKPFCVWPRYLP